MYCCTSTTDDKKGMPLDCSVLAQCLTAVPCLVWCCLAGCAAAAVEQLRRQLAADPYTEWWSLQFDPAAESRAHDHLSSLNYMPVMLQVVPGWLQQVARRVGTVAAWQEHPLHTITTTTRRQCRGLASISSQHEHAHAACFPISYAQDRVYNAAAAACPSAAGCRRLWRPRPAARLRCCRCCVLHSLPSSHVMWRVRCTCWG